MASIYAAVCTNDLAAVKRFVEQDGVSPAKPCEGTYVQQQPLHFAARCGHLEIMAYLLDTCGVDIEATTKCWPDWERFQNALHIAVDKNNSDAVLFLLQHNADPNARNSAGFPPLFTAVYQGYDEVAKTLMEDTRCDLDMGHSSGINSLIYVLLKKKWEMAELLLKKGASPTKKMPSGALALDHCKPERFPQHIKDIIKARHDSLHAHILHRARCICDAADDISAAIAKSEGQGQAAHTYARTRGQKRRMVLAQTPPYLKERVERGLNTSGPIASLPRVEVSSTHLAPGDETAQVQRAVLLHVLGRDENGGKGGGVL
jgi:hypothetical protein